MGTVDLCLKDNVIAVLQEGARGELVKIEKMLLPELLPLCMSKDCTIDDIRKWLKRRGIPENREGLSEMIRVFGDKWLSGHTHASLSDQYWIRRRKDDNWRKINFFTNRYSIDIAVMSFRPWQLSRKKINNNSPDLTTSGVLRKCWIQDPITRASSLVKASSPATRQEPLSEVLVSVLLEKLNLPYLKSAQYDLHIEGSLMCSKCPNFITPDTELVPASYFYYDIPRKENESIYQHLVSACERLEIPNAKEYIDGFIAIDKLTGNSDRHLGNITFIRDLTTGMFLGPSPLIDCGNAYWSTKKEIITEKSQLFSDVEQKVFNKLMGTHQFDAVLKSQDYASVIEAYPGIGDEKKSNMIRAIQKQHTALCINNELNKAR